MTNYYTEFNLDPNASCETLCAQLFKEKRKWITRQNANSMEKRQEAERKVLLIEEASKIFSDKLAKEKYDVELMRERKKNGGAPAPAPQPQPVPQPQPTQQGWTIDRVLEVAKQNQDSGNSIYNIDLCRQAISHGMENVGIYNYLARAYWENGNIQNAAVTLEAAMQKYPNEWTLYYNIALMYLSETTKYKEAREYIDKLMTMEPNDTDVKVLDIYCMILTGQIDAAEAKIQDHLRENPTDQRYREGVANAYLQYSDKFLTQASNGGAYYPTQEAYSSALYYRKKANELNPNERTNEIVQRTLGHGKRKIDKESKVVVIGMAIVGIFCMPFGILLWLAAAALGYFTFIPVWKTECMELSNHRNIANMITHALYKVVGVYLRFQWWLIRTFFEIFLHV